MEILVIDGQGGGIGRQVVQALKRKWPEQPVSAVGTNGTAAEAMRKAGADRAASGENAVRVACRKADLIIGPIGIVIADSMLGEITPSMALSIAQADATRILIPVNHCDNIVAGTENTSTGPLIQSVVARVGKLLETSG